ncbi:hypothetical protein AQUCO_04000049v1 [Aquilegia coerulea]|uniref:Protein FAR1-RELATED SEQUENCE n=1 Tax=Aquilegia coerulea TaxID=218851 RepID=A0A2G5CRB1_AQUCA|nr:hypothetical protein AQUCO_04000049v1 [Aquilegia coerulea]
MSLTKTPSSGSVSCWIRKQQCPCGERKCYIRYEEEKSEEEVQPSDELTANNRHVDVAPPHIGQVFETDDEAFEYYRNFARNNGFAIRKESSRSTEDRGVYIRVYACHRYGPERIRTKSEERKRGRKKSCACGCEARMYILKKVIEGSIRWIVRQFHNNHNHELLEDDQVRHLPAYRKIPHADRERILSMYKTGCSVRHIMKVLQLDKGGNPGNLPFIDRDVRNFLQSCKKVDRGNDVSELLDICKTVKESNPEFFFDYSMDDHAKLENIAWSYGNSVRAYRLFGDVVIFYATYREISYDRLLGVWFGIDNYGKPIFFGCVLLRDETAQSYAWALQVFLRFMQSRYPQTILTDLDLGLKDAITSLMPYTKHVTCIWHIVSKLWSWFSFPLGSRFEEFKTEFDRLYSLETKKDFECQWNQMVTRFSFGPNKHISLLFSLRTSWALPYIRGSFLANMTTAECSKSLDAFLKQMLWSQTSLESFFQQVGIVANDRNQSRDEVVDEIHIKTSMPIEEHASSILTPYAFSLLQHEIVQSMQCAAIETANGSYVVRHHKKMDGGCLVSWTAKDERICCSCREFEVSGILCRHALRVLALKNYFHLPEKYLPIRWRQECLLTHSNDNDWSNSFQSLTSSLFAEASMTKERVDYVHRELARILNHVKTMAASDEAALNLESVPAMEARVGDVANGSDCNITWNSHQLLN